MAAVLLAAGQTELADRWTRRCVSLGENEPSCLLAQGDWAMSKGDLKTARLRYEKVTRLAPGDRRAWQKLGGAAPRSDAAGEPEQVAPVDEPAVEPAPAPEPATE
jgi:Flp pilus assembly protein TadD